MNAIKIESDRLVYKPLSLKHLSQDYVNWLNDPDVYRYLETGGNYNMDMLNTYLQEVVKKDILFWAIHLRENDLHIGNIKIDPVSLKHGTAEYGIMMGRKSEWGKGYAKEATLTIIDYCFKKIGLRKITLGVVANNKAAYNLYVSIGFEIEGICKKDGFYDNKYCDGIRMAMFNIDFKYDQ